MLLSIVICNHNYGQFLDDAIRSAVEQSHADTEVIVVDDGSTDNSRQIVEMWVRKGRVQAILQGNAGQVSAYNRGFEAARGEAIIFLDSDDNLDPDLGGRVVEAFSDPAVVKVHYALRLVAADGSRLGPVIPRELVQGDQSRALLERALMYVSSPGSGNAYRRSALARLMPLPLSTLDRHGADYFALLGISLLGEIRALGPEPLANYRVHTKGARERTMFGNAGLEEPYKTSGRYQRLRTWLVERLGPQYTLPPELFDFSTEKQVFANLVFGESYLKGLRRGLRYLETKLARSIWRRETSVPERVGLIGWALAVLVLPRDLGMPIARYVCNPASRH